MKRTIYETVIKRNPFPINAFVASIDYISWHWHEEYEIIGVLEGKLKVIVQSAEIVISEGEIILINSEDIHSLQKITDECLVQILQFPPELLMDNKSKLKEGSKVFYLCSHYERPTCGFELFFYRLAKINYEILLERENSNFRIIAATSSLVADLLDFSIYETHFKDTSDRDSQELLIEIIKYIEDNLGSSAVLENVCNNYGMSRKTLDRLIRSSFELSAKDLLEDMRIQKAKNLLKFSTLSTNKIMADCGYTSENTFYRNFKKITGITPKEFKDKTANSMTENTLKGYLDYETPKVMNILKGIIDSWENRHYKL